jgi:hypothetical protein
LNLQLAEHSDKKYWSGMAGVAKIAVVPTNFMSTTYSGVAGWVTTWRVTSLRSVPDVTGKSTNDNQDTRKPHGSRQAVSIGINFRLYFSL